VRSGGVLDFQGVRIKNSVVPPCFHEQCRIAPNRTSSCAHQTRTFSNVFDFVLYETFSHAADNVRATAKTDRFDQCAIIDAEQMSVEQTRRLWFGERHEMRPLEAGDTLILAPICPLDMRQDAPTISLAKASDRTAIPFRSEPAPLRNS
jgi:hypothetical protein